MSSYEEWCPVCKSPIVMVTRGIPSMGRCMNGHTSDRRDTLRREPEKVEALPTLSAAMELPEIRALVEAVFDYLFWQAQLEQRGPANPLGEKDALIISKKSSEAKEAMRAALAAIKEPKT